MKISICIPCYNAEKWISTAIESALNQVDIEVDVIVIDDGSSDNSLDIIKSFGDRIIYHTGDNQGGNFARNKALHLATGEWVQFLDGDDYLEPRKIINQLNSLSDSEQATDVIYSPVKVEEWRGENKCYYDTEVLEEADLYEQWIRWQVAQTGTMLWKKRSLQKIGGWNEKMPCCQDNELTMRAIMSGLNFHYYPKAEAVYRHWSQETVCRKEPSKVIEVKVKLFNDFKSWLGENQLLKQVHREALGQACFEMARSIAKNNLAKAVKFYKLQKQLGMIYPRGDSFPRSYCIIYKACGFRIAETVAKILR